MPTLCVCEVCGKTCKAKPSKAVDTRFCSKACQQTVYEIAPGTRFGRWTVIQFDRWAPRPKYGQNPLYLCRCDCGTERSVMRRSLMTGRSQSCGCYHREVSIEQARQNFTKHGLYKDPDYIRCLKHRRYHADRSWTVEMESLLNQLQPACVVCGATCGLEIDHVYPAIKGGGLIPGNVVRLCRSCNAAKHDKDLSNLPPKWGAKIRSAADAFAQVWKEQSVHLAPVGGHEHRPPRYDATVTPPEDRQQH